MTDRWSDERRIHRRWTPNGWIEWLEPDWGRYREREPVDIEFNLRAGIEYALAAWYRSRWKAWTRETAKPVDDER